MLQWTPSDLAGINSLLFPAHFFSLIILDSLWNTNFTCQIVYLGWDTKRGIMCFLSSGGKNALTLITIVLGRLTTIFHPI